MRKSASVGRQFFQTRLSGRFKKGSSGFTIAEVSIATAIFAVILLIALAIFFGIGRLFYKGVTVSQTQEVAQQVYQDIVGSFQSAGSITIPVSTGNGYSYYCVGNVRYTYNQYPAKNTVNLDSPNHAPPRADGTGGNFGILKDTLSGNGGACGAPCNDQGTVVCSPPNHVFNNPVELLGQNMRLSQFRVTLGNSPNIYNVSLVIAYGDSDVMNLSDPANPVCLTGAKGSEFCSVSKVSTAVYRGLNF
ncbi:MAG TPA: prepilin-type N-terminal cleavage/methylation domain-containing protein [Candidatus Saccharimonadales bacterium]|nr:prepilin-type N-terminal cleavage/methylation domain-containing protein [Candidatus Saccharimonadales bacterium]